MSTSPTIHVFPVEILTRAFSCLDLGSLFQLAHVCGQWRTIVFEHPDYWGRISITDMKPGTLSRSRHRLAQGRNRPLSRFDISYTRQHSCDDPVLSDLIPMLRAAVPRARILCLKIESMYRLQVEDALCQEAPLLRRLLIFYASDPLPDLHYNMPLGYKKKLCGGFTGNLRTVQLFHVLLPSVVIQAFENVDEVFFMQTFAVRQYEFRCYLFDHFPNMTRLRLSGGTCHFTNAPLPREMYERISRLAWFDLEFPPSEVPPFFRHLPLHDLADLTIGSPDEDGVYLALEPLQSWFDLTLSATSALEFMITVKSRHTPKIRRFAEPLRYYHAGSIYTNALLENSDFADQLASFHIDISLWSRLRPWLLPSMDVLPKLILELDEDTPFVVRMPPEPLPCAGLQTLVVQAKYECAYVGAEDLVAFADRLTARSLALELRRVLVEGPRQLLEGRFTSIEYSLERYLGHNAPPPAVTVPK